MAARGQVLKYDQVALPMGSDARAKAQLENLDLMKFLGRAGSGLLKTHLRPDLDRCLDRLYAKKCYGTILSAYYMCGAFGEYSILHLLKRLHENRDLPTLLKQAYRFDVYAALRAEVDEAIGWHAVRRMNDTEAWRRKFAKLREQEILSSEITPASVDVSEELPDNSQAKPRIFELTPISVPPAPKPKRAPSEPDSDPYVVSQAARAKTERANILHQSTLEALRAHLTLRNRDVSASKLIDAYSVLTTGPAIFEIKSINEANERDQIRHALSQLYEYRFLHSLADASLWIVFSQAPSSQWYIDYLAGDRGLKLVWLNEGRFEGPSINLLT